MKKSLAKCISCISYGGAENNSGKLPGVTKLSANRFRSGRERQMPVALAALEIAGFSFCACRASPARMNSIKSAVMKIKVLFKAGGVGGAEILSGKICAQSAQDDFITLITLPRMFNVDADKKIWWRPDPIQRTSAAKLFRGRDGWQKQKIPLYQNGTNRFETQLKWVPCLLP